MRRVAALAAVLAGCAPAAAPDFAPVVATRAVGPAALAAIPAPPGPARPARPGRIDNAALARDLMEVAFTLESGRALPVLTRFEGPVRVRLVAPAITGTGRAAMVRDLAELMARLRAEAGIDIARDDGGAPAEITVQAVPARALRRAVPGAACFVAPGVASWDEWRAARRGAGTDWTRLTTRTRAAIFLPEGAPPQEVRDCLHEELAQALGPVGDLHRMTASVFNDDNFHAVLTPRDMLMLRAINDPALRSGMTPAEVRAALPAILSRLNPRGGRDTAPDAPRPDPEWQAAIAVATGSAGGAAGDPDASRPARRRAAEAAMARAPAHGPLRAYSLYVLGRVALPDDPARAARALAAAQALYDAMPDAALQSAHVALPRAALALAAGDAEGALALAGRAAPVAVAARNAALLAALDSIRSAALTALGRPQAAAAALLDSRRWARYAFGSA